MSVVAIPPWTASGVLPPVHAASPVSTARSPYTVSLAECMIRFGQTPDRRVILEGLLRYRASLHAVGLVSGFQWLDGSFLEHVERLEGRPPRDVDVVTFFRLPAGASQENVLARNPGLFLDHAGVRAAYRVDGYLEHLGMDPERLTRRSAYWYSVWSHRRDAAWKGFVQVDLAPEEDAAAAATLATIEAGAHP